MENLTGEQYKMGILIMDIISAVVEARSKQLITSKAALRTIRAILAIGE